MQRTRAQAIALQEIEQRMNDRAAFAGQLGAEVRRRRVELGLRQEELADLAETSERFVHVLETGKPTVRMDKVLAVLTALGLDLQVVVATPHDPVDE